LDSAPPRVALNARGGDFLAIYQVEGSRLIARGTRAALLD
jgi:hypothetical protein